MAIEKQINKPLKTADDALKFIEQNFNVKGSVDFSDVLNNLVKASKQLDIKQGSKAAELASSLSKITILSSPNDYIKKFDRLGNFNLTEVKEAYKAADEIINDINVARRWLASYQNWLLGSQGYLATDHEKLVRLGLAILGRAVELCPKDTGFLRSSAVMVDLGTSVVIAFTAPYASYVHENLNISHPIHGDRNCGGRAKFLEIATQEFFPNKQVWTDVTGYGGIEVSISLSPDKVVYRHYGSR